MLFRVRFRVSFMLKKDNLIKNASQFQVYNDRGLILDKKSRLSKTIALIAIKIFNKINIFVDFEVPIPSLFSQKNRKVQKSGIIPYHHHHYN